MPLALLVVQLMLSKDRRYSAFVHGDVAPFALGCGVSVSGLKREGRMEELLRAPRFRVRCELISDTDRMDKATRPTADVQWRLILSLYVDYDTRKPASRTLGISIHLQNITYGGLHQEVQLV